MMITLTQLLLPAVVAGISVFVVSSIVHMLTPWHAGDFQKLPNEEAVLTALRPFNLIPGEYVAPRPAGMKDYITSRSVGIGADRSVVFKFVAAITFAAYAIGQWQESIWYSRSWTVTIKSTIDGILYGCVTAVVVAWLWPR